MKLFFYHQHWLSIAQYDFLKTDNDNNMILYFLQSKVRCFYDCNNNSQNKITHTNRNNNMQRLRQGVTFVVYTKELVVWQRKRANIRSNVHQHIRTHTYTLESIWKSNWDFKLVRGLGALFGCAVCLSLVSFSLRSFRKCLFRDEWLAEMSRGFLLIWGFLERQGRPATVAWLNSGSSGALPSDTIVILLWLWAQCDWGLCVWIAPFVTL